MTNFVFNIFLRVSQQYSLVTVGIHLLCRAKHYTQITTSLIPLSDTGWLLWAGEGGMVDRARSDGYTITINYESA